MPRVGAASTVVKPALCKLSTVARLGLELVEDEKPRPRRELVLLGLLGLGLRETLDLRRLPPSAARAGCSMNRLAKAEMRPG